MVQVSQPIESEVETGPVRGSVVHDPRLSIPDFVVDVTDPEGRLSVDLREPRVFLEPSQGLLGASLASLAAKRAIDIVGAAIGIALLSPVFLLAAIMIRLSSPGPAFYRQQRVGQNGMTFGFLKFRTMTVGADKQRSALEAENECDGPIFKIREDPRVTTVGRILRKFSIDELPQLFHVLKGDMSLVGPRPPLPKEVETYDSWERQRLLVKPGISCIWQVSGRSDLDFETWVNLDVAYIRDWDLFLDLEILAKTIPAVLSGRGAY